MALRLSRILMGSQTLSLSLSLYSLRVVCAAAIIGLLILVIIKREGQARGTEKINLIDPWLRKFLFEAPQSLNIDARRGLPTLGLPPYRVFTLEEIDDATNNFDATNLMGEGSQGLQKQLPQNLDQSMEALPKLRHRHLVSLLGHCTVTYQDHPIAARNVFIVLENISNGSLVDHLTGKTQTKSNYQITKKRVN
ncbi:unnamed protein product [Prunus armeniaca]|uniref:Protein kinase domain-containing protein n=1 Tax=Prunus armeniaca TaxID=36596 RepID=A0A6J5TF17_PRUAR|nr:unnamed protein product [Prunus armeniaca]